MSLYKNKYRNESFRRHGWDYSWPGRYFITICTAGRKCILGEIINAQMHLSDYGKIVHHEWMRSFDIRNELSCDTFCIMPNHIHAVIEIKPDVVGYRVGDDNGGAVGTHGRASLRIQPYEQSDHIKNEPQRQNCNGSIIAPKNESYNREPPAHTQPYRSPKSISSFVAGFKSVSTKRINEIRNTPRQAVWQKLFHDHIIRNDDTLLRIRKYINRNLLQWQLDDLFPEWIRGDVQ